MDLVATLRDRWKIHPSERAAVSGSTLAAFEAKHGIVLPRDLRTYFLELGGTEHCVVDDEASSFWPLEKVDQAAADGPPDYFAFADWMIESGRWAIRLSANPTDENTVLFDEGFVVAKSFTEFMGKYLKDINSVR